MPELPEAETIARGLRGSVVGRTIRRTEVVHQDVLRQPKARFARALRGRTIERIDRRGKKVLGHLDDGAVLVVNLGMTGRLLPSAGEGAARPASTHPAVRFRFHGGGSLVFDDQRRFGCVEVLSDAEWAVRSARLGPEPLGRAFTREALHAGLRSSRTPVRSWLLDQRRVAGVGNIYAAEALHRAGIHPKRPADRVTREEATALREALRSVLRAAIDHGGTTLRDYRNTRGEAGEFGPRLLVYGREGERCRCGTRIERLVFSNRSAFFCPRCQPASRVA